jgi:hypothetical protein
VAELNGLNPSAFNICGFPSAEEATACAKAMVDGIANYVCRISFGANLIMHHYESIRQRLSEMSRGWHIDVAGEMDGPAALPIDEQDLSLDKPGYYPAFTWWEGPYGPAVFGAVLIENGHRHLEIATDGGTLQLLQERISFQREVRFKSVLD